MNFFLSLIRGAFRIFLFAALVLFGFVTVLLLGWIPLRYKGIGIGPWIVHAIASIYTYALAITVKVNKPEAIRAHGGFLFANHTTYVDILVILATIPVRFVAKAEIRRWPFIGWLAIGIGCVFVKRESRDSRKATRQSLTLIEHHWPPVVLFPEGKTAPVGQLLPFRKGAFEIAHAGQVDYLPVAIMYSDHRLIDWKTRSALSAWWEMLSRPGRLFVELSVFDVVSPKSEDDPVVLMEQTRRQMLDVLVREGGYQAEEQLVTDV